MALFHPFRCLGAVTDAVPFAVQRRGRSTFVTTAAGKYWQLYNCAKLTLLFVGGPVRAARGQARAWRPANHASLHGAALAADGGCSARCTTLHGAQVERSITALASKNDFTFAAYGPHVAVFRRRAGSGRWASFLRKLGLGG